jgi:diguanylate cyclase (GGDEF)-like protein
MSRVAPSTTELDAAHRAFRAFSLGAPYGLVLIDRDLVVRWASASMADLTGIARRDLVGRVAPDLVHPDDLGVISTILDEAAARRLRADHGSPADQFVARDLRVRHASEGWVVLEAAGNPLFDDPGVQGGLIMLREVGEQRDLDRVLRLMTEDAPLDEVLPAVVSLIERQVRPARASVVYEDGQGIVRHVGDPALAGALRSRWRRRPPHRDLLSIPMAESAGFAEIWEIPFGSSIDDAPLGAIYVLSPVADALRSAPASALQRTADVAGLAVGRWHARAALDHASSRDALTGLPNRASVGQLLDRLTESPTTSRDRPVMGVLHCGLDDFKDVNDRYGQVIGDAVLQAAAARMLRESRSADMCARVGGDEFVIVCSRLRDNRFAQALAHRLVRKFAQPFEVDGATVTATMSVGVATTRVGAQIPHLLGAADRALSRAKQQGNSITEIDVLGALNRPPEPASDRPRLHGRRPGPGAGTEAV